MTPDAPQSDGVKAARGELNRAINALVYGEVTQETMGRVSEARNRFETAVVDRERTLRGVILEMDETHPGNDGGLVYLVWAITTRGTFLRVICTSSELANRYRNNMMSEDAMPSAIKVWVEKTWVNHAFGDSQYGHA